MLALRWRKNLVGFLFVCFFPPNATVIIWNTIFLCIGKWIHCDFKALFFVCRAAFRAACLWEREKQCPETRSPNACDTFTTFPPEEFSRASSAQDFVANFSMNFGRVSSTRYMCAQRRCEHQKISNSLETESYLLHYLCCIGVTIDLQ